MDDVVVGWDAGFWTYFVPLFAQSVKKAVYNTQTHTQSHSHPRTNTHSHGHRQTATRDGFLPVGVKYTENTEKQRERLNERERKVGKENALIMLNLLLIKHKTPLWRTQKIKGSSRFSAVDRNRNSEFVLLLHVFLFSLSFCVPYSHFSAGFSPPLASFAFAHFFKFAYAIRQLPIANCFNSDWDICGYSAQHTEN